MQNNEVQQALITARRLYSQSELASLLKRVPRTIARWESGQIPIPPVVGPALQEIIKRNPASQQPHAFTFIDLFAGIGGLRLAFQAHGGKCVYTSEWDSFCQKAYRANFPDDDHEIAGDITQVDAESIPDHDVLVAGFPCQPFSLAGVSKKNALGRPHGFECTTQGTLFFDVARIIATKQPSAFLLENVKNLVSHDGGNTFRVIRETLEKQLGYHVMWKILDGKHFVPQHRERIMIVGFKQKSGFDWSQLNLPDLKTEAPRLSAILHPEDGTEKADSVYTVGPKGLVRDNYVLTTKLWNYLKAYAEKHRLKGNGFGFGLFGPEDVARTLSARYYKDGSEILIRRGKGRNPRRLTPRECARIMGFPDSFKIVVSDTRAYKQFGNSVVVPLATAVAGLMKIHILAQKQNQETARLQPALF